MSKRITKIGIRHVYDDVSTAEELGEYTDELSPGIIVRKYNELYENLSEEQREDIPSKSREFRFWKPANPSGSRIESEDYRTYALQDYERAEALNNGEWNYIGIYAYAYIVVNNVCQTIRSGGLYGIESDSLEQYLNEVGQEELTSLRDVLKALGFKEQAINAVAVSQPELA